jgi:hypothetical protein
MALTGTTHARPSVEEQTPTPSANPQEPFVTFLRIPSVPWRILSSQQHARRNALVACTALTERRRERLEVEEFLAAHGASAGHAGHAGSDRHLASRTGASAGPLPAAHSA